MSVDGVLISDVRRLLCDQSISFFFVVTGPSGSGKSHVLRSFERGILADSSVAVKASLESCIAVVDGDSSDACLLRVCSLDFALLQKYITTQSHHDALFRPDLQFLPCTIVLLDDMEALWSLCFMNGQLHYLKQLLSALFRSPGCALVSDAISSTRIPMFMLELRRPLLYTMPPLTAAASRRMVRGVASASSEFANLVMASEVVPATTSRRSLLMGMCCAASTAPADAAPALERAINWIDSGETSPTTGDHGPLYGLDDIQNRLSLLVSVFASVSAREGGKLMHAAPCTTGILLHGPSGCGKSAVARRLQFQFPSVFFSFVECTTLFSKYLGDSEEMLRAVYRRARAQAPAVVILNDVDVISQSRGAMHSGESSGPTGGLDVNRRMLAGLLCELDGVTDNSGVLTIGTTNAPHVIDGALLRQGRLETRLLVPALTKEAASQMSLTFFNTFDGSQAEKCALAEIVSGRCLGAAPAGLQFFLRKILEHSLSHAVENSVGATEVLPLPAEADVHAALLAHWGALLPPSHDFTV